MAKKNNIEIILREQIARMKGLLEREGARIKEVAKENLSLQAELVEANEKVSSLRDHRQELLYQIQGLTLENAKQKEEINNFLSYGQGGATFKESQLIDRLYKAEVEIDGLKTKLTDLEGYKQGFALIKVILSRLD